MDQYAVIYDVTGTVKPFRNEENILFEAEGHYAAAKEAVRQISAQHALEDVGDRAEVQVMTKPRGIGLRVGSLHFRGEKVEAGNVFWDGPTYGAQIPFK